MKEKSSAGRPWFANRRMQILQDNFPPFGGIIQVRPTTALHLKGRFQYQVSHQYEVTFMMTKGAKFGPHYTTPDQIL